MSRFFSYWSNCPTCFEAVWDTIRLKPLGSIMSGFVSLFLLFALAPSLGASVGMYPPQASVEGEQWETWELIAYLRQCGFEVEIEDTPTYKMNFERKYVRVYKYGNTKAPQRDVEEIRLLPKGITRLAFGCFLLEGHEEDIARIKRCF